MAVATLETNKEFPSILTKTAYSYYRRVKSLRSHRYRNAITVPTQLRLDDFVVNLARAMNLYDTGKHIEFQQTMVLVDCAYKKINKVVKAEIDEHNADILRLYKLDWSTKFLLSYLYMQFFELNDLDD